MSAGSDYQRLRAHQAFLRLGAAAEALPGLLDEASAANLSHSAFLERLLATEVEAVELRRRASLARFASLPSPFTLADFGDRPIALAPTRHASGRSDQGPLRPANDDGLVAPLP